MPTYSTEFKSPQFIEETIQKKAKNGEKVESVGTIRIKPSSVLWKPKGKQQFYAVPLDRFASWIVSDGAKAKLVKK